MDAIAIDHLNLRIPPAGTEQALDFYRDTLGFEAERVDQFESGETSFFAIRLTPRSVIHFWPDPDFEPPTGTNYDHVAIHVDMSGDVLRERLEGADIPIEDDRVVRGASGTARSLYVRDPFRYLVELKTRHGEPDRF